ncbi:protein kinase [Oceanobacillus sp. J11TS1]|uniref:serine/threonine protein kinase n=1 Tax=Oceanobacillus sp. J11TS1 TaxID=2807191 RepID=UPI001B202CA4|nr:protein kinase [Oceanobacillus sp. J11TS1]GIO24230.1 putative serine/threonine-protein kinase YabT [Oceanobacillus sp. J11TS1]
MKNHSTLKKPAIKLHAGQNVIGKWHHQSYTVVRKIGEGAIGAVYLCTQRGRPVALKISEQDAAVTVEVNVLKALKKVQGYRLGPSLLDVDDWTAPNGRVYSFYVMEYMKGDRLGAFIQAEGKKWLGVLMIQLLDDLEQLHQAGWTFGDLKTDNILVESNPPRIRLVDVGGTTRMGRSIKEYTEFFDRGYWGLGTRKAEPSYDLFAVAMVFLHIYYPRRFDRVAGEASGKLLEKKLYRAKDLDLLHPILKRALKGKYLTASEMKKDVIDKMKQLQRRSHYHKKTRQKKNYPVLESFSISIVASIYWIISLLLP